MESRLLCLLYIDRSTRSNQAGRLPHVAEALNDAVAASQPPVGSRPRLTVSLVHLIHPVDSSCVGPSDEEHPLCFCLGVIGDRVCVCPGSFRSTTFIICNPSTTILIFGLISRYSLSRSWKREIMTIFQWETGSSNFEFSGQRR